MTIADFLEKQREIVQSRGIGAAAKSATHEVAFKGLSVVDGVLARPIWADSWDICLVLDSCRLDAMQDVAHEYDFLPDDVPSAWSVGSASPEWISKTFGERYAAQRRETAYVTANPFTAKQPGNFRDERVYPLRDTDIGYLDEVFATHWREDAPQTVYPKVVTNRAKQAYDTIDLDRLVVHYMQPHMPFRSRPGWFDGWGGTEKFGEPSKQENRDIWLRLRDGDFKNSEFWQAYLDNLRWVLDDVEQWIQQTDARILITSDHGNGAGEFGIWGHPPGIATPQIKTVPWILVDGCGEEQLTYQPTPDAPAIATESLLNEQLKALGYK